jgi:hypothetical protein
MINVFWNTCKKLSDENNFSKCFHPTHRLAAIPSKILKSLKAMIIPYIGVLLKQQQKYDAGYEGKIQIPIFPDIDPQ